MTNPEMTDAVKGVEFFYSVLKSIDSFNEAEVKGVVMGLLSPAISEECLITTYYRAAGNVKTLLELRDVKHFQAIGMLARNLFELTVDAKLLQMDSGAALKMAHFKDVELLRACRTAVAFRKTGGGLYTRDTKIQESFISREENRIETVALAIWPGKPLNKISHWTGMNLYTRVNTLDVELKETYACFYRQLSWNVHAGLQGMAGLKPETFAHMCAMSYDLASRVYRIMIEVVINAFKLHKHDPLIEKKLSLARFLPITESLSDEVALRHDLGL